MEQITFSIMSHWPTSEDLFREVIEEFLRITGIQVELKMLPWETGRRELIQYALDRSGPDVSEIGSTWLSELASLGVIHPFTPQDQVDLDIPGDYFPQALNSCRVAQDPTLWALPWFSEALLLWYRQDLLHGAGLQPRIAFSDIDAIAVTAEKLGQTGVPIPFAVPDRSNRSLLLQTLATWIWRANAEFISTDGNRNWFNLNETIDATVKFMSLLRYCTPQGLRFLDAEGIYSAMHKGLAAMTVGGLWMKQYSPDFTLDHAYQQIEPELLPGPSFIGGSNLVVWKHSRRQRAAVEFAKYLASIPVVAKLAAPTNYVPSRWLAVSDQPPYTLRKYQLASRAVLTGKTFPNVPLWGALEEQINTAIVQIWAMFLADPGLDLRQAVSTIFTQANHQLNAKLAKINR